MHDDDVNRAAVAVAHDEDESEMITWFKLHHDLPDDIKIRRFTPQEKWAWVVILCLASKSKVRGVIDADDEDIAAYCELNSTQDWLYFRDKLIAKGMLEIGPDGNLHVLHWEDRQYEKPSDSPTAIRDRVRRHRAKKKEKDSNVSETRCNALQTPVKRSGNAADTDTDPDPDTDRSKDPTYFLDPEGREKEKPEISLAPFPPGDPFEQGAAAKNAQIFLMGLDGNTWNIAALKAWASCWEESGRNPGKDYINLKKFIRKRIHPKAEDHQSFLDEYQGVRASLEKPQGDPQQRIITPPSGPAPPPGTPEYRKWLFSGRVSAS